MSTRYLVFLFGAFAFSGLARPAIAEERVAENTDEASSTLLAQPPSDVEINTISAAGSGCATPGSVVPVIGLDRQSFVVIFNDMQINYDGVGGESALQRKNCVSVLNIRVPQGFQVSIGNVTTRGFASLDLGHRAQVSSNYFLAGVPQGATFTNNLPGGFQDFYAFTDNIAITTTTWSPCGRPVLLGVNTSIFLDATANRTGKSLISTDTQDGAFQKVFHVQWRTCH